MNKLILKGNLVDDPKKFEIKNNKEMYVARIAVWKGKNETEDFGSDFFDVSFFNEKAFKEIEKFKKGEKVEISAKLTTYTDPKNNYSSIKIAGSKITLTHKVTAKEKNTSKPDLKELKKQAEESTKSNIEKKLSTKTLAL